MPKYKVFRATGGFYDMIVAAPSRKAAIEAWGAEAKVFENGFAAETHDPQLVKLATQKPYVVFRRLLGKKGDFVPKLGRSGG